MYHSINQKYTTMIFRELGIALIFIVFALGALTSFISVQIYHRNDAPLEQFAEDIVEDMTGVSVDFTAADR